MLVGLNGYQPNAIAYSGRWKELPLEIGLKVRDTLAGLLGATLRGRPADLARHAKAPLTSSLRVIACVVQERRRTEPDAKRKVRDGELRKRLQQRLGWLACEIQLVDPLAGPGRALPGVTVSSL